MSRWVAIPVALFISSLFLASATGSNPSDAVLTSNGAGILKTISVNGPLEMNNPFFLSLGTNGRKCSTCHDPAAAWSITPEGVTSIFDRSKGLDPLFRLNDGSVSPVADISTLGARRKAFGMLLTKGLIRVERPIPAGAEFELVQVDDPYGYADADHMSLFRRPLPSTNLRFISTVMWDGREVDPTTPMTIANSQSTNAGILFDSLSHQALDATNGHAQAAVDLTPLQRQQIVNFELGLSTAESTSKDAGDLDSAGAAGGPEVIAGLPFYVGINDNVNDPAGPFTNVGMNLFNAWHTDKNKKRQSIARGQDIFNSKAIVISGVKGLNNNPYFGSPTSFTGTCTTCHNTPGTGNHSLAIALDIGLTDGSRRTPDMPLYWLRRKSTGEVTTTTDPGLALGTGKWNDIGRFKGPVLRGLAARAPYFHNGSAKTLEEVVDFYTGRFGVTFTTQERKDLVAFLESL